jgi:hypothetical protein
MVDNIPKRDTKAARLISSNLNVELVVLENETRSLNKGAPCKQVNIDRHVPGEREKDKETLVDMWMELSPSRRAASCGFSVGKFISLILFVMQHKQI